MHFAEAFCRAILRSILQRHSAEHFALRGLPEALQSADAARPRSCRHHHLLPEARLPEGVRRWQVLSEGRLLERMRLYEEAARARGCRHRRLPIARLLLRILRVLRMPLLEEAAERSCRL